MRVSRAHVVHSIAGATAAIAPTADFGTSCGETRWFAGASTVARWSSCRPVPKWRSLPSHPERPAGSREAYRPIVGPHLFRGGRPRLFPGMADDAGIPHFPEMRRGNDQ